MVCSLYTPGIEYVEPDLLGGVTLDTLPAAKWGAKVLLNLEPHSHEHVDHMYNYIALFVVADQSSLLHSVITLWFILPPSQLPHPPPPFPTPTPLLLSKQ